MPKPPLMAVFSHGDHAKLILGWKKLVDSYSPRGPSIIAACIAGVRGTRPVWSLGGSPGMTIPLPLTPGDAALIVPFGRTTGAFAGLYKLGTKLEMLFPWVYIGVWRE